MSENWIIGMKIVNIAFKINIWIFVPQFSDCCRYCAHNKCIAILDFNINLIEVLKKRPLYNYLIFFIIIKLQRLYNIRILSLDKFKNNGKLLQSNFMFQLI